MSIIPYYLPLDSMFSLSSLINDSLIFQPSQSGQANNIRDKISDFKNKWWEHIEGMKEICWMTCEKEFLIGTE
jgi:hypothetical protein